MEESNLASAHLSDMEADLENCATPTMSHLCGIHLREMGLVWGIVDQDCNHCIHFDSSLHSLSLSLSYTHTHTHTTQTTHANHAYLSPHLHSPHLHFPRLHSQHPYYYLIHHVPPHMHNTPIPLHAHMHAPTSYTPTSYTPTSHHPTHTCYTILLQRYNS